MRIYNKFYNDYTYRKMLYKMNIFLLREQMVAGFNPAVSTI